MRRVKKILRYTHRGVLFEVLGTWYVTVRVMLVGVLSALEASQVPLRRILKASLLNSPVRNYLRRPFWEQQSSVGTY